MEDLERNEVWRDLFRTGCGTKAEKKESPGRLPKLSAVIWTSWTVCWIVTMLVSTQITAPQWRIHPGAEGIT